MSTWQTKRPLATPLPRLENKLGFARKTKINQTKSIIVRDFMETMTSFVPSEDDTLVRGMEHLIDAKNNRVGDSLVDNQNMLQ
jgi:hypothetical protein